MIPQEEKALRTKKRRFRKTKPPLLMFSQRNNPYCELLQISAAKIRFFSKPHKLFKYFCTFGCKKKKIIQQMKKILGLDLGTNSIGWAVVNEAETADETSSIIKLGVRVNPLSVDEASNFEKGKSITTNADRTLKRSARRNLQRYKQRRELLVKIFINNGFIDDDTILSEHGNRTTFETYRLRAKAVGEEISLEEFARVLLMINKKRGYKSSRKAKSSDEGQLINGMAIAEKLYQENITPGELVLQRLKEGKYNLPEFYRSDLQVEFDKIWNCQKGFYPTLLTDELKERLNGKNSKQTWGICREYLGVEGMKRLTKGVELKKENYSWRVKGLTSQLDLEQLVVVLQELNTQLNKTDNYLGKISNRSKELYFTNKTVGQYLMEQLEANPNCSLTNQVFYRQDYLDEFEKLWETQAQYHQELTNELKHEIGSTIIFYQRPLKSQKGLIGICELEQKEINIEKHGHKTTMLVGPRVCPKSSPLFQEFKIRQTINNLQIEGLVLPNTQKDLFGTSAEFKFGRRNLNEEEKQKLFEILNVSPELSDKQIIELLFGKKAEIKLNFKSVAGNTTNATFIEVYKQIAETRNNSKKDLSKLTGIKLLDYLKDFFKKQGYNADLLNTIVRTDSNIFEHQSAYRLWHLIYSFEGDSSKTGNNKLIKKISDLYGFEEEYASMIANIIFPLDYGNLSTKAICKILPYLRNGSMYSEACELAGYKHSKRSLTKVELEQKTLKDHLELLPKNSLRNPVVEKILNQMINVVNQVIETYGKPDEIRIELARELKKSAKERDEADKRVREAKKKHDDICKTLKDKFGIENPSRNDIIRYKLYDELRKNGYHTLYTDTYIPQEKLFSKEFDIEHIIPQALRFDDSFSNKTLETRSANIEKGKKTAYDYISGENDRAKIEAYENRVRHLFDENNISKAKLRNLLTKGTDIDGGFINRDLRDSQYIAKKAREILENIVKVVTSTTGSITDRLREDWQLVNVMRELNWNKYDKLGQTYFKINRDGQRIPQIMDWSKRNDHRHHAMDALTIAFTKPSYIQYLNNLHARVQKSEEDYFDLDLVELSDLSKEDRSKVIYAIERKELHRDKNGKLLFNSPMPLDEFRAAAKAQLEGIIVSIKSKNKVTTRNTNITKTGKGTKTTIQLTPRGELHEATIHGKIRRYATEKEKVSKSFTAEEIATVACKRYREALLKRLEEFGGDPDKAFGSKNSLEKNPLFTDIHHSEKVPAIVKTVRLEPIYTIRKPIDESLNITKVVDREIKRILEDRLKEFGGKAKEAFANLDENPIWLNREKGIVIKRVTIGENMTDPIPLHSKKDKDGNYILNENGTKQAVDFVKSGNNHHVAIYCKPIIDKKTNEPTKDENGTIQYEMVERCVSFFETTIRANNKEPIIDKAYNSDKGWQFMFSMKRNEYFVFPRYETVKDENGEEYKIKTFDPTEIDLLDSKNYPIISPNLFRVQKLSSKDYWFRHHLETTVDNENKTLKDITWKRCTSFDSIKGIVKVRINHIGQIVAIGDY